MKRIITTLLLSMMALVMLQSCGKDDNEVDLSPLYGTWRSVAFATEDGNPVTLTYYLKFNENSTLIEVDVTSPSHGDVVGPSDGANETTGPSKVESRVFNGTWVYVGGEIILQGGGVIASTSTKVVLLDNTLTIIGVQGSHVFSRVADSSIKNYL